MAIALYVFAGDISASRGNGYGRIPSIAHSIRPIENSRIRPRHTATLFDSAPSLLAGGDLSSNTADSAASACLPGPRPAASSFLSARATARLRWMYPFFVSSNSKNLKTWYGYTETLGLSNLSQRLGISAPSNPLVSYPSPLRIIIDLY